MKFGDYPKMSSFNDVPAFKSYAASLNLEFPCDLDVEVGANAPLAWHKEVCGFDLANRFAVLPMEGWDAQTDGRPSDNTRRRWRHFGKSGAKFIWGGEAVAVRGDGRANARQLCLTAESQAEIASLRDILLAEHNDPANENGGGDVLIGLQLTHSGRFCKPNSDSKFEPFILYHHPLLDKRFGLGADYPVMSDDEIESLIQDFVLAAKRAQQCGFNFVDVKHCHGYLGHEFLSAVTRPGRFGGSLENRTRFLREIVAGIRAEARACISLYG